MRITTRARSRLHRESVITWVFIAFYVVRVLVMDLGYSWLVLEYYSDSKEKPWNSEDILEGEKKFIFIGLYALDFLICMALLALFYMYSRKSTEDEERLKNYFLMSLREAQSGLMSSGGLAGMPGRKELENDSFIIALR